MATQRISLGTPFSSAGGTWRGGVLLDSRLLANENQTGYLRYFRINPATSDFIQVFLRVDHQASGGAARNRELSTEFENHDEAITLTEATAGSVTISGPGGGQFGGDTTEPYTWWVPARDARRLGTWLRALGSGAVTLELSDGETDGVDVTAALTSAPAALAATVGVVSPVTAALTSAPAVLAATVGIQNPPEVEAQITSPSAVLAASVSLRDPVDVTAALTSPPAVLAATAQPFDQHRDLVARITSPAAVLTSRVIVPLGVPQYPRAAPRGVAVLEVSWRKVPDADSYRVEVSSSGRAGSWALLAASVTRLFYEHTGLKPGTTRYYRVRANSEEAGNSGYSETARGTTDAERTALIRTTPTLIAQRMVPGSLTISESLQRRTICTFRLLLEPDPDSWPGLDIGQPITVRDSDGTLLFAGTVHSDDSDELLVGEGPLEQLVTAVDYTQVFDRFKVGADYQDMPAGDVVRDILTNSASSSIAGEVGMGKRITLGTIVDGPEVSVLFNYSSVRSALDELSELTGLTWLLSPAGEFSFRARSAGTARTPDFAGLRISRSRSRQLLRNRQYVRGGQGLSGVRTETFTGDGQTRSFSLAFPVGTVPRITVDGVDQEVGIRGVEVEKDWYWSKGDSEITQESGHLTLRTGAELEVRYRYEFPILAIIDDAASQTSRRGAEGGTGLYESLETDDRIPSPGLAVDRGRGLLRRHGSPEEHLTVTADDAFGPAALLAARPGDLLEVENQRLHIDGEYLVESVETRDLDGLHLEKSWELTAGEAYGGWMQHYRRLAASRSGELEVREGEGVQLARSAPDEVARATVRESFVIFQGAPAAVRAGFVSPSAVLSARLEIHSDYNLQLIGLGAASRTFGTINMVRFGQWQFPRDDPVQISDLFTIVPTKLRNFRLTSDSGVSQGSTFLLDMRVQGGPMTSDWAESAHAITIQRHRGDDTTFVVVPGPGHSSSRSNAPPHGYVPSIQGYNWVIGDTVRAALNTFFGAHAAGDTYSLLLSDR